MAKYSYDTYEDLRKSNQNNQQRPKSKVGYFRLKDGEEAVVRFAYSSPKEFDIVTVHNVKVGNGYRKVSCLRTGREPLENCPFCAKGEKVSSKFFAKLIHYTKDENGRVIATPEVACFAKRKADELVNFIQEYGDLRDILIKIRRTGSGLDTEYSFVFANPAIYKEELGYVKDFKDFEGLDLAHHSYVEKSKEDIEEYLKTGDFPFHKNEQVKEQSVESVIGPDLPDDDNYEKFLGQIEQPKPQVTQNVPTHQTTQTSDTITNRPRRTYDFSR